MARWVYGVMAEQFEAELDVNLASVLERFKSGWYHAPAVRTGCTQARRGEEDTSHWNSDAVGQSASACGRAFPTRPSEATSEFSGLTGARRGDRALAKSDSFRVTKPDRLCAN